MPKPFPNEFRGDVVRVARNRDENRLAELGGVGPVGGDALSNLSQLPHWSDQEGRRALTQWAVLSRDAFRKVKT